MRSGLTQREMAKIMNLDATCISKYENNRYNIAATDLFRWIKTTQAQDLLMSFMLSADVITSSMAIPGITGFILGGLAWI